MSLSAPFIFALTFAVAVRSLLGAEKEITLEGVTWEAVLQATEQNPEADSILIKRLLIERDHSSFNDSPSGSAKVPARIRRLAISESENPTRSFHLVGEGPLFLLIETSSFGTIDISLDAGSVVNLRSVRSRFCQVVGEEVRSVDLSDCTVDRSANFHGISSISFDHTVCARDLVYKRGSSDAAASFSAAESRIGKLIIASSTRTGKGTNVFITEKSEIGIVDLSGEGFQQFWVKEGSSVNDYLISTASFREEGRILFDDVRMGSVHLAGTLPSRLTFQNSSLNGLLDIRLADTSKVSKINLMFSAIQPQQLVFSSTQLQSLEFDTGHASGRVWEVENLYSLLAESLRTRGDKAGSDMFMMKFEETVTGVFPTLSRKLWGLFFGYGYQPWRWLLFVMVPCALFVTAILRVKFLPEVLEITCDPKKLHGSDRTRFSWIDASHMGFALIFSLRFRTEWLTSRFAFNFVVVSSYALGLALYVVLLVGSRSTMFETAKNLLGL